MIIPSHQAKVLRRTNSTKPNGTPEFDSNLSLLTSQSQDACIRLSEGKSAFGKLAGLYDSAVIPLPFPTSCENGFDELLAKAFATMIRINLELFEKD